MSESAPAAPATPGQPVLRWKSRVRSLVEVEQELARIWSSPAMTEAVPSDRERHVAARTSVLNLVVIAPRPEIGERAAAEIALLAGLHPSRSLILTAVDPDGPSWFDAQIHAQCILPRSGGAEMCAELVYVTAGGDTGRHLGAIVAPLLIHDLPIALWLPGDTAFHSKQVQALLDSTDQVIVDGSGWTGTGLDRLAHLADLLGRPRVSITDFALTRQARWREAIASVYDLPDLMPELGSIRRITVDYATHDDHDEFAATNLVKPIYHVAWLASRLRMDVLQEFHRPNERLAKARAAAAARRGEDRAGHVPGSWFATLKRPRGEVDAVLRPVYSAMPAGTTLRVEIVSLRKGSQVRSEITARADSVVAKVWRDEALRLERTFLAPRRREVDLLARALEASGRDPIAVGTIRTAADLAGFG